MLKKFYPDGHVHSVLQIDYMKLFKNGYRGILFDIDNTLVHHGDDSTEEIDDLFRKIHQIGLKTIIISNNNEERIKRFIKNIHTQYIAEAGKPDASGYLKAVEMLGLPKDECVCVGDQIFTDIYGANKSNIDSILVDFIRLPEEKWFGKRRILEKIILKFWTICRMGKTGMKYFY